MYPFYLTAADAPTTIYLIPSNDWELFADGLSLAERKWLAANQFIAAPQSVCCVPGHEGEIAKVFCGVNKVSDFWLGGVVANQVPVGQYQLDPSLPAAIQMDFALTWGMQSYRFTKYKANDAGYPSLLLAPLIQQEKLIHTLDAIYLTRDLINTPTEDLGPAELANAANQLATRFGATLKVLVGEELLAANYPAIHMVGRAASRAPRLIDLTWGEANHPKVTLVGKGVCFDTGGLNIKNTSGMQFMKKDMGGAAHVLGLAALIMAERLPIRLRVLIPAVENSISGNAYRPGDVMQTRKGTTVEIGNTDAEGRLILADALYEAHTEFPECIIDFATLTGAMRVALGTEIAGFFTNDESLAADLKEHASKVSDPVWQMPLFASYRNSINGKISDLSNVAAHGYAGGIIAALFLQEFVGASPWVHFDVMAWNLANQPGRIEGGEAMGLRTVYSYLHARFYE